MLSISTSQNPLLRPHSAPGTLERNEDTNEGFIDRTGKPLDTASSLLERNVSHESGYQTDSDDFYTDASLRHDFEDRNDSGLEDNLGDEWDYDPLLSTDHLNQDQIELLSKGLGKDWSFYRSHRKAKNETDKPMDPAYNIGLVTPTDPMDWLRAQSSKYLEGPLPVIKGVTSVLIYSTMGAVMATTVLGAMGSLGISAGVLSAVAVPVLIGAGIWGGTLGLYNDLMDRPLLPNDFTWLDGLTKTAYLRKFEF